MSLLRLLATGKSLIGVKDTDSPYRMTTQNLLPKFPLAKNPFASAAGAEPAQGTPAPVPALTAEAPSHEPAKLETVPLFTPEPKPSAARDAVKDAGQTLTASTERAQTAPQPGSFTRLSPDKKSSFWSEWMKKINPFTHPAKNQRDAKKTVKSKTARSPVQAELSLERVRVVRNELNDTDLELIPMRMGELRKKSAIGPAPGAKPGHGRWGRLTAKFVREGQAQNR